MRLEHVPADNSTTSRRAKMVKYRHQRAESTKRQNSLQEVSRTEFQTDDKQTSLCPLMIELY